jgi:HTH-type transcriptional regulator, sugar sensing transcriptional regulator
MTLKELKKIGLTDGEIKVYKALLELGETTKTNLAKKAEVSPSNIYDITNRLLEKGIISKVEKNGVAHFSPANPKHILNFIDQKEKELESEKKIVKEMLPILLTQFKKTETSVNIEVFQGWKGMKTIFEDLLEECKFGDRNYIFGAGLGKNTKQAEIFFPKYSRARAERGIITNIIYNENLRNSKRIEFMMNSDRYKLKFMSHSTPTEVMIYKDKTCIIILVENPLVIRITNKEVMKSFKQYFNSLWEMAKK